jgi:hypothetical protein
MVDLGITADFAGGNRLGEVVTAIEFTDVAAGETDPDHGADNSRATAGGNP